ncbi:hypothetical protein [Rheinheimera salexigens]|uniref:hypothetical protein n=1 Tax=Rheinheimera salexigens TaxID=1628148 RepID=UPI000AB96A1A|nr:hypothetical protein [Rheinheimera salexigens]
MAIEVIGKSNYSKQILVLIAKIYDNTLVADSVYEQAIQCFSLVDAKQKRQTELEQQLTLFEHRRAQGANKEIASLERQLQQAKAELQQYEQQCADEALQRFSCLKQICITILQLTQGETEEETRQLSAKMLGTIQLLSPTEGRHIAITNQKSKHLYKAVLSLRLLDKLLADNHITDQYILQRFHAAAGSYADFNRYHPFRDDVQIPLLMAALLQDIGSCHPQAQQVIYGEDGKADPFRVMSQEERASMLQVSYSQSIRYTLEQIQDRYQGNSKAERDFFNQNNQQKKYSSKIYLKAQLNLKMELVTY